MIFAKQREKDKQSSINGQPVTAANQPFIFCQFTHQVCQIFKTNIFIDGKNSVNLALAMEIYALWCDWQGNIV